MECSWFELEMEFVRKVRKEIHLVKCNYVKVFSSLLLFCKFFQGIDKMFFIFAARLGKSAV